MFVCFCLENFAQTGLIKLALCLFVEFVKLQRAPPLLTAVLRERCFCWLVVFLGSTPGLDKP